MSKWRKLEKPLIALALAIVWIILTRFHTFAESPDRDVSGFAVIGRELVRGRSLYSDLWDIKPPLLYVIFAIAHALFGTGHLELYVLGVVSAVAAAIAIYCSGRTKTAGAWSAVIWALISGGLWTQGNLPTSEVIANVFLAWAFYFFVIPRRMSWAGLMFALASLVKHNVVVIPLFVSLSALAAQRTREERWRAVRDLGLLLGIGVAAWFLVALYFAATGRAGIFFDTLFKMDWAYAGGFSGLTRWVALPSEYVVMRLPHLLALGLVAVLAMLLDWKNHQRAWAAWGGYAFGALVAVSVNGTNTYPHYYQFLAVPLALGAGWACDRSQEWLARAGKARPVFCHSLGGAVLLLLLSCEAPTYLLSAEAWSLAEFGPLFVHSEAVGGRIDKLLKPDETFFEWGDEVTLYFASQRSPVAGQLSQGPAWDGPVERKLRSATLQQLKTARPALLILPVQYVGMIERPGNVVTQWLAENYARPSEGKDREGIFVLYALKGSALAERLRALRSTVAH